MFYLDCIFWSVEVFVFFAAIWFWCFVVVWYFGATIWYYGEVAIFDFFFLVLLIFRGFVCFFYGVCSFFFFSVRLFFFSCWIFICILCLEFVLVLLWSYFFSYILDIWNMKFIYNIWCSLYKNYRFKLNDFNLLMD